MAIDNSSHDEVTPDVEPKDKNLQLKQTATYQAAVQALAKAKGYKTISDYLQALLDAEIAAASEEIDDLETDIDARKAQEADKEKAALRSRLSEVRPLVAVRTDAAAS